MVDSTTLPPESRIAIRAMYSCMRQLLDGSDAEEHWVNWGLKASLKWNSQNIHIELEELRYVEVFGVTRISGKFGIPSILELLDTCKV